MANDITDIVMVEMPINETVELDGKRALVPKIIHAELSEEEYDSDGVSSSNDDQNSTQSSQKRISTRASLAILSDDLKKYQLSQLESVTKMKLQHEELSKSVLGLQTLLSAATSDLKEFKGNGVMPPQCCVIC